ncbi:MAG TPA: hypothetical protein PLV50_03110 [Smithella sp.]|nr:hypothetical protein [Smithella sp.]
MEDQIIGEITLGQSTKLIFSLREWKGRNYASVRKFVATQKYIGATKSGMVIDKKILREITVALSDLERSLPSQTEQEIKCIPGNGTNYIKIATLPSEDVENLPAVDVREFVNSPSYQGPTKSGIRFRWNLLPDVLACFNKQLKVISELELSESSLFGTGYFAEPDNAQTTPQVSKSNGIDELLGAEIKLFPDEFLENVPQNGNQVVIPEESLSLAQDRSGKYYLKTDECIFCEVRNPAEGNFIIYSQMRGHKSIIVPNEMIQVFKAVKAYENYVRTVQGKLITKILKKVGQRSVAEYEAWKKMSEAGLPLLG